MLSNWTLEARTPINEVITLIKGAAISQRSPSLEGDKTRKSSWVILLKEEVNQVQVSPL